MWDREPLDPELARVTRELGLHFDASAKEWTWRLMQSMGYSEQLKFAHGATGRQNRGADNDPIAQKADENAFYAFLDEHPRVCRVILEGRIGYYDRLLPLVSRIIEATPHARIADLGCHCGLTSIYLGGRFPQSRIVGIERVPGMVRLADEFRSAAGLDNVSFQQGDYNEYRPACPFDVVLSIQSIPGYMVPWLPSLCPEDFCRGSLLEAEIANPYSPVQDCIRDLNSIRRLIGSAGTAIVHTRFHGLPRTLLFCRTLTHTGFQIAAARFVDWTAAGQMDERQSSPLFTLVAATERPHFDENAIISQLTLTDGAPDFSDFPENRPFSWEGLEAHAIFRSLAGTCDEILVRGVSKKGFHFHLRVGVTRKRLAYVYHCDRSDVRKLTLSHTRSMRPLFEGLTTDLQVLEQQGEITGVVPPTNTLGSSLANRFARYAS